MRGPVPHHDSGHAGPLFFPERRCRSAIPPTQSQTRVFARPATELYPFWHHRRMELYHSGTDDILGVCGDEETETGLAHTPRYEPSWFYQEVPSEMVDRCLRARSRGGIDEAAALWLHKHLVAFGHAANAHSCHFMAHSWFECAYGLKDGAPELISSINMRLHLGQATLAKQLYERVLQQREVPRSKWVDGAQPLHSPACSRRDPDPNQANSDP